MENTDGGHIYVVDGEDPADSEVFIDIKIVHYRIGKRMVSINQSKIEPASPGIQRGKSSMGTHPNKTDSLSRYLVLAAIGSDAVVLVLRRRYADVLRPYNGKTNCR